MVGDVTVMDSDDEVMSRTDVGVVLDIAVYDPIAASKGFRTVTSQAKWHGLNRATMHALRAGENVPRLDTAMRIASDCGVRVEALWKPREAA